MPNREEARLLEQIARGDEQAFLMLYDRHAGLVYALALRILGDPMLAEEATQDTFMKVWGRAHQFDAERGALQVWLLTITRHTAFDRLRHETRRPALSGAADPEELWRQIPEPGSMEGDARWRSLAFTVRALPSEQRQVIELAYFQGMSQSEIAEVLGWPLGTVKTRLRAAMEKLRDLWGSP